MRQTLLLIIALAPTGALHADDAVQSTAQLIDEHIFTRLDKERISPAAPSSDAEFYRRVWLDLAGKIPRGTRALQFVRNKGGRKRQAAVDELLDSPRFVAHYTSFWRNVLIPEVKSNQQVQQLLPGFDVWLGDHVARNTPYDKLVREIVTTPLNADSRHQQARRQGTERSPIAFYQAKQIAPENLAAATSRIFLGIRLECAQCHDHPFDEWTRKQFWSYASFFAGIERQGNQGIFGRVAEVYDRREMLIPDTETVVQAGYLDGSKPRWRFRVGSRETLADWLVSPENPYFARMAVNRVWGKLFGVGLVDPIDDFTEYNPCSHPKLLDALAARFVEQEYDLKFLIKAIVSSRAYQLSSARHATDSATEPHLFSRMSVKGLSPEQLYDSFAEAAGMAIRSQPAMTTNRNRTPRDEFLELFANDTDPPTAQQTSILQSLAVMNGRFTASAVNAERNRTLRTVAAQSTPETQVESLFYATLSRPPRDAELNRFTAYLKSGGSTGDANQALADVFWALLNSTEFMTNH